MLCIGLMSGTSMDGVDAALLELNDDGSLFCERGDTSIHYTLETQILLKAAEYSIRKAKGDLNAARTHFCIDLTAYLQNHLACDPIKMIETLVKSLQQPVSTLNPIAGPITLDAIIQHSTQLHINSIEQLFSKTGYSPNQITVIGYHGQSVYHNPKARITRTIGDPQAMANHFKIPVVFDFRANDVAAGGQGAPFAPLYHHALAKRDTIIPVGVINCGGIANVTLIPTEDENHMMAFDTGPGNGLIDAFVRQKTFGTECMDRDGIYGKQGTINGDVLQKLFAHSLVKAGENYLLKQPPKSLDIADMMLIPELHPLNINDGCATLEHFTAHTIVDGLKRVANRITLPRRYLLCGGGWKNPVIRSAFESQLRAYFCDIDRNIDLDQTNRFDDITSHKVTSDDHTTNNIIIESVDAVGWNSTAMEAQIFAFLAARSLDGKPLSIPQTTAVPFPMTGGVCYRSLSC